MRVAGRARLLVQAPTMVLPLRTLTPPLLALCALTRVNLRFDEECKKRGKERGKNAAPPAPSLQELPAAERGAESWLSPQKGLPFSDPRLVAPSVWRGARHPCLRLRVLGGQPALKAQA